MRPYNPSVIDEIRVARLTDTVADRPLLEIVGSHGTSTALNDTAISGYDRSGATADPDFQSVTVDADGTGTSASPLTLVTLKYGVANSAGSDLDTTTYGTNAWLFSHDGGGANETAATSLKDLADQINALTTSDNDGRVFKARVVDELSTFDLNKATLTDVSETRLGARDYKTGLLHGAVGTIFRAAKRFSVPEAQHNGRVRLLGISGSCTGNTSGTVKLYRDDIAEGAPVELHSWALQTAQTDYLSYDFDGAPVYRGSLVLVVESSNLSTLDFTVRYVNAEY